MRFSGLDITVYSSDAKRSPGHLARQGSPELRWALFEAAKSAARPRGGDLPGAQVLQAELLQVASPSLQPTGLGGRESELVRSAR